MPSILIADDSSGVRGAIRKYLDLPRVNVLEAVDGLDAVDKANRFKPDLIILDLSMPRMNGLDAARLLHPLLPDVPIILFTVYAEAIPRAILADAGITVVVSKANITALVTRVESMLPIC